MKFKEGDRVIIKDSGQGSFDGRWNNKPGTVRAVNVDSRNYPYEVEPDDKSITKLVSTIPLAESELAPEHKKRERKPPKGFSLYEPDNTYRLSLGLGGMKFTSEPIEGWKEAMHSANNVPINRPKIEVRLPSGHWYQVLSDGS